jgi:uncharacterized membrane protein YbjE (DUF340 family)
MAPAKLNYVSLVKALFQDLTRESNSIYPIPLLARQEQ